MLCQEMKWDYFTFSEQPSWFIELLSEKINIDNYFQNIRNKKANGRR